MPRPMDSIRKRRKTRRKAKPKRTKKAVKSRKKRPSPEVKKTTKSRKSKSSLKSKKAVRKRRKTSKVVEFERQVNIAGQERGMVKSLLKWKAREFVKYEKDPSWYVIAVLFFIVLLVLGFIWGDFITIITFVLLGVVVFIYARKEPDKLTIEIFYKGIRVGDIFYDYKNIRMFWILYDPPYLKTLNIVVDRKFLPVIRIQLEDQDPFKVRDILRKFIPEDKEKEESFSDQMARILKI